MNIADTATAAKSLLQRFDVVAQLPFARGARATTDAIQGEVTAITNEAEALRPQLGALAPDGLDSFLTVQPADAAQFASRSTSNGIPPGGNGDLERLWRMRAGIATMHAAASAAATLHVEPADAAAAGGLQAIDGASRLFTRSLLDDGAQQLQHADEVLADYRFPGLMGKGKRTAFVDGENAHVKDPAAAIVGGVDAEVGHLLPGAAAKQLRDAAAKVRFSFIYSGDVLNDQRKAGVGAMRTALQDAASSVREAGSSDLDAISAGAARVLGGEVRAAAKTIAGVLQDSAHIDALRSVLADPAAEPAAVTAAMRELVGTSVQLGNAFDTLRTGVPSQAMTDVTNRAARLSESLLASVQSSPHAIVLPESTQAMLSRARSWNSLPISPRYDGLVDAFAKVDASQPPPRMVADVLALAHTADDQLSRTAPMAAALHAAVPVDQFASRVDAVDDLLRAQEDAFWQVERIHGQAARPGLHPSVSALQAARLRTELATQVSQAAESLLPEDAWRLPSTTLLSAFAARNTLRELATALLPFGDSPVTPHLADAVDTMAQAAGGIEQLRERLGEPGAMDLVSLGDRQATAQHAISSALAHLGAAASTGEDYLAIGQALPDYSAGITNAQAVINQLEGVVSPEILAPISRRIDAFGKQVLRAENRVSPGYGRVLDESLYPKRGEAAFIEQDLKTLNTVLDVSGPESI